MSKPKHIAIIMDGNGRWAQNKLLPRVAGYPKGIEAARNVVKMCLEHQIQILSLFAFSSENWQRPKSEIKILMDLLLKLIKEDFKDLHKNEIKLTVIGDINALPQELQEAINNNTKLTYHNPKLQLNIAINYGGKWDLVRAVQLIAEQVQKNNYNPNDINENLITSNLSLNSIPDPDLFIRTSGEQRISNFFLWQLAYTELFFTKTLWPDFSIVDFKQALDFYQSRVRKFGAITNTEKIDA